MLRCFRLSVVLFIYLHFLRCLCESPSSYLIYECLAFFPNLHLLTPAPPSPDLVEDQLVASCRLYIRTYIHLGFSLSIYSSPLPGLFMCAYQYYISSFLYHLLLRKSLKGGGKGEGGGYMSFLICLIIYVVSRTCHSFLLLSLAVCLFSFSSPLYLIRFSHSCCSLYH